MVSEAKRDDYREAFNLFDKDKDGFISVDELQTVMRSVGHNPTNAEVRELINQGQYTQRDGKIDFELFCDLMGRKVKDSDTEAELRDAFRCLDEHGEGYIGVSQLRLICKNLGEDLTDDEVYKMVGEAISNFDGKVYYDGFKKIMIVS